MVDEKKSQPVDVPEKATPVAAAEPVPAPQFTGSTFAERRAAREAAEGKAVKGDEAEDKAVSSASTKSRRSK